MLVATEVALAVVVLFSTGLMIRTIVNLQAVDPGFRPENVLTANLSLTATDYPTAESQNAFYREVLERVRRLPGVVSAGFTTFHPYTVRIGAGPIRVEGRPDPGNGSNVGIIRYVTPDYLHTIGVPLVSGRGFSDQDAGKPGVALVSERVPRLSTRIRLGSGSTRLGMVDGRRRGRRYQGRGNRGAQHARTVMRLRRSGRAGLARARRDSHDVESDGAAAAVRREIWASIRIR
jgi:hypothetical protein